MPVPFQKSLKRYPILSAIISVCIFLFWHLPEWLGNVWPLFSDMPLPQWIAERRWPGVSPELFSWISMGLGIGILILLGIIIYQIPTLKAQIAAKDDELKRKDEQLSQYSTLHHSLPPPQSALVQLSNIELQQRSLVLVQYLHSLLERLEREEPPSPSTFFLFPSSASEEERHARWQHYTQEAGQVLSRFLSEYNRLFKTDVILLRDELRSRLQIKTEGTTSSPIDRQYEHPVNSLGIKKVVSDFERLAKSLPTQ